MLNTLHAHWAGPPVPENGEGCEPASSAPLNTLDSEHRHSRADARADQGTEDKSKTFANLRAALALAGGFALHELSDGSYLVSRWNCTRPLPDLRAVAAFVRQVGGLQ